MTDTLTETRQLPPGDPAAAAGKPSVSAGSPAACQEDPAAAAGSQAASEDKAGVPAGSGNAPGIEPAAPEGDLPDLLSMTREELAEFLAGLGEKSFRAKQIYDWLHVKGVRSFEGMTNLPRALRDRLCSVCRITVLRPVQVLCSKADGTKKYLFALSDGNVIESVMMRYSYGISVCISSQVGCRMGCRFCASTIGGRIRSLTAAEMLSQVTEIQRAQEERVSHVVVMGSGEPFDNYEELVRFLRLIGDEKGENLSLRNITVSTCGLVPEIRRFAEEGLPVTLALSLHASSQKEREILMPIAKKYELREVLDAMNYYFSRTGRRITFEYSCVQGVNTSAADAERLKGLLKGMNCHINLIPVNPVEERSFRQPDRSQIEAFKDKLEKSGINVTIRREMGRDISGACGQLRRSYLSGSGTEEGSDS